MTGVKEFGIGVIIGRNHKKKPEAILQACVPLSPGYYSAGEIASVGHTSAHDPQSVQSSGSIT